MAGVNTRTLFDSAKWTVPATALPFAVTVNAARVVPWLIAVVNRTESAVAPRSTFVAPSERPEADDGGAGRGGDLRGPSFTIDRGAVGVDQPVDRDGGRPCPASTGRAGVNRNEVPVSGASGRPPTASTVPLASGLMRSAAETAAVGDRTIEREPEGGRGRGGVTGGRASPRSVRSSPVA